ncbi:MAG TPA: hypothetical protein VGG34_10460 [Opitutaceae bacterium]|jgi:hypothetical protein
MSDPNGLFRFGVVQGRHELLRIHFVSKPDEKHALAIGWNSVISRVDYHWWKYVVLTRNTIQSAFDQVPGTVAQDSRDIFRDEKLWLDLLYMLKKLREEIVSGILSITFSDDTKSLAWWPSNYSVNTFTFGLSQ